MKRMILVSCATLSALATFGIVIKADLAVAQPASEEMKEIVVEAPVERPGVARGGMQAPIEQIELKRRVSYADLDLSKDEDVTELRTRIETTAKESCEQLAKMFPRPQGRSEIASCNNRAVDSAEEQVQAAIAAAK